ncbi:MAG: hypothetical protein RLN89_06310 [Parvibaculum sp.]
MQSRFLFKVEQGAVKKLSIHHRPGQNNRTLDFTHDFLYGDLCLSFGQAISSKGCADSLQPQNKIRAGIHTELIARLCKCKGREQTDTAFGPEIGFKGSKHIVQGFGTSVGRGCFQQEENRLSPGGQAVSLELSRGQDTALARVNIIVDSLAEHDARTFPEFALIDSDITGCAVFEKGRERLEVFTANRHPLENVFGVDLIYFNVTRQNIVMVQYEMLEPHTPKDGDKDWVYRPDSKLDDEVARMKKFSMTHPPKPYEYRLNPQPYYLKFVKRDGALSNAGIVMPIDHFERLRADPSCKGPRGAVRVSFESLAGRYLRQGPFLDLIRAGYIGATTETTSILKTLVEAVVDGDKAVVGAIQSYKKDDGLCHKLSHFGDLDRLA